MGTCRAVTCCAVGQVPGGIVIRIANCNAYIYVSYDQGDAAHLPEDSSQLRSHPAVTEREGLSTDTHGVELRIYDWYDTIRYDCIGPALWVPSACCSPLLLPSTLLERLANQLPLYIYIFPLIRLLCGLPKLAPTTSTCTYIYIYLCVCVCVGGKHQ